MPGQLELWALAGPVPASSEGLVQATVLLQSCFLRGSEKVGKRDYEGVSMTRISASNSELVPSSHQLAIHPVRFSATPLACGPCMRHCGPRI